MHPKHPSHSLPALTPLLHPWIRKFAEQRSLIRNLITQYGSPINVHNLVPFAENYGAYRSTLQRHQLEHQLFFARKANKCRAFVKEARALGFGVDTASYRELQQCLAAGCNPDNLVVTAAMKTESLLRLAINHKVLIILDNEDECRLVNKIAHELGRTAKTGVRISGFRVGGTKLYSRFGFDVSGVAEFIGRCLGEENKFPALQFEGLHFHLDGYSISQRGEALLQTIRLSDTLQQQGITTGFIDIGGGFLTNYLSDKTEWTRFWDELKKAVRGERAPLTFGNDGLGYTAVDGRVYGKPEVYPYYNESPKEQFLDHILSGKDKHGRSAASLLRQRNISFRMEPGRSLLDQTGVTIAQVRYRKRDYQGTWLVGLEMNRSQLFSSSADFLLDPVFISLSSSKKEPRPTPVYFTGGYCLEQDIILKRKIMLPQLPEIGDVICFPNTAGYMMHFYETQSHLYDFSMNLVAKGDSPSTFIEDQHW